MKVEAQQRPGGMSLYLRGEEAEQRPGDVPGCWRELMKRSRGLAACNCVRER